MRKTTAGVISLAGISIVVGLLIILLQSRVPQPAAMLDSPLPTPTVREPEPTRKPTEEPKPTMTPRATETVTPSGVWLAENIEIVQTKTIDAPQEWRTAEGSLLVTEPKLDPTGEYMLLEHHVGAIPCSEGVDNCYYPESALWLYEISQNRWSLIAERATYAAWSPDGTHIAFLGQHSNGSHDLSLYNFRNGHIAVLVEAPVARAHPQWVKDHTIVYATINHYVQGIEIDERKPKRLTDIPISAPFHSALKFSVAPDGEAVALLRGQEIWLVPLGSPQKPIPLIPPLPHLQAANIRGGMAWSYDGQYFAYSAGDDTILIYDAKGQLQSLILMGRPHLLNWSPDGNSIAALSEYSDSDQQMNVSDIVIGNNHDASLRALSLENIIRSELSWSRNGKSMVTLNEHLDSALMKSYKELVLFYIQTKQ